VVRQAKRHDAQACGVGGPFTKGGAGTRSLPLSGNVVRNGWAVIEADPIRRSYRNKDGCFCGSEMDAYIIEPMNRQLFVACSRDFSGALVVSKCGYVAGCERKRSELHSGP
jgi:hypothetical protein